MAYARKILKAERLSFEKQLNAYLNKVCVLKDTRTASDCVEPQRYIETKYGVDYRVHEPDGSDHIFTLTGAFAGGRDEYEKIRADGIDCNPYTGKWNFHLIDCSVDEAINHIVRWLEIIRRK